MAEYRDDVEADFLAIYRIDDPMALPGPRFFKLAWRLPNYQGAIRARAQEEADSEVAAGPGTTPRGMAAPEGAERADNWAAFSLATGVPVERVEVKRDA